MNLNLPPVSLDAFPFVEEAWVCDLSYAGYCTLVQAEGEVPLPQPRFDECCAELKAFYAVLNAA